MPLVAMAELLKDAKARGYAVPAFNVWDLQSIWAIKLAAEEEDAPVILAGADLGNGIGNPNTEFWACLALKCARESSAPIAVHLDHGRSLQSVMQAISLGFSSVMIDASDLPFDQNVAITRKVVEAAHAIGVTVEAELGHVGLGEDELTEDAKAQLFTQPAEAVRFVQETGVDALAVAVGTLHGPYRYAPQLDWARLEELARRVPAYLVLHGASDTPDLDRAVRLGVTKMNIGHEVIRSLLECIQEEAKTVGFAALKAMLNRAPQVQKDAMVRRLRYLGASGKGRQLAVRLRRPVQPEAPGTGGLQRRGEFG